MDLTQFGFRKGFNMNDRLDMKSDIELNRITYTVSTVDLGLDHSFGFGPPLYYETMIFVKGDSMNCYCNRYTTEEQAREGHENILKLLKNNDYKLNEYGFEFKEEF